MVMVVGVCVLVAGTTIILCNLAWPIQGIPKDWSVLSGNSEQWNWTNGAIYGHSTSGDSILASGKEYHNVTLSAIAGTTNREASLAIRMQDVKNGYLIVFVPDPWGRIALVKKVSGDETVLASYHGGILSSTGKSAKITVAARGPLIEVRLNGTRVLRVIDSTFITGLIGFRIHGSPDWPCDATFSKVTF
jgi:hypothetical protein